MEYEYNDYELVYLVSDVEEAVDLLIKKYEPIVRSMAFYYARNFKKTRVDVDDLMQEGRIGLIQAIRKFKNTKNVLFYTFAILCIKSKMLNYLDYNSKMKNYIFNNSFSIDDVNCKMVVDSFNLDDEIRLRELEKLVINFKNDLDFSDALIFELKLNNFSYKEISELLDEDMKRIDNRLYVIRKKFKKFLLTC